MMDISLKYFVFGLDFFPFGELKIMKYRLKKKKKTTYTHTHKENHCYMDSLPTDLPNFVTFTHV